uniref:hypothetical protein n=1 Tax=Carnobacterium sp. TaxID=48221 RepID=UPI00344D5710
MQEGAIMEIVKWFLYLMLIVMLVSATLFFFQVGDTNNFKQKVNYEIERQGGLTEEAVQTLNKYSEKNFDGRYTVESEKLNQKVAFGEIVDYQVKAKFNIAIIPIPDINMEFSGSGVSQVR